MKLFCFEKGRLSMLLRTPSRPLHLGGVIVPQRDRQPVGVGGQHLVRHPHVRVEEQQSVAHRRDTADGAVAGVRGVGVGWVGGVSCAMALKARESACGIVGMHRQYIPELSR